MNSNPCVLTNTNEWFSVAKPNPDEMDLQNQIGDRDKQLKKLEKTVGDN